MLRVTPLVRNLIIINIVVFVAQQLLHDLHLTEYLSLWPLGTEYFRPYQFFTYMLAHGGYGHIFFNMLALASFAPILETYWGDKRFLAFYIAAGIGAGVIYAGLNLVLGTSGGLMLGASGAIYGILAAFGILFPNMEISLLFPPIPIKAKYMVFVMGGLTWAMDPSAPVAHLAHFGGAVMGALIILYWRSQGGEGTKGGRLCVTLKIMFEDFKNAFQKRNNAHVQLIIINVAVFLVLALLYVTSEWTKNGAYFTVVMEQFSIPTSFTEFTHRPWTIITYFFTHNLHDIFHILGNMLFLYWFGRVFIEYLGSDKLVALYVLGGLTGGIAYLMVYNLIPNPPAFISHGGAMVGASAAIFAIMVGTATLLPDYTFYLLFLGPVKIKYIAAFFILISFLGTVESNAGGNIAHLGGVIMGYVYIRQLKAGYNWGGWITATLGWGSRLFKASPKVKVTYRKPDAKKPVTSFNKATQEEIDVILDKISDRGYESLSKEEKEKLFNASKK